MKDVTQMTSCDVCGSFTFERNQQIHMRPKGNTLFTLLDHGFSF